MSNENYKIEKSSKRVTIITWFGLELKQNDYNVYLTIPEKFKNNVEGICSRKLDGVTWSTRVKGADPKWIIKSGKNSPISCPNEGEVNAKCKQLLVIVLNYFIDTITV